MEPSTMTMDDYFAIVKRRKWSLILPAIIVFIAVAVVALALPSIYKSTSTILIEEQEIPADFVMTTVTSYAEQRLQSIHQRIVSFPRLLDLINRFNLYPGLKNKRTDEEIVAKMREDITLEPISIEAADRRTRTTAVTIAFTLSYEGKNPGTVHRVANILTSMFLEENLQVREKQARETTKFLENEMEKVKDDLSKLEAKMAVFKGAHMNELPELLQVNMQSLNNIENNIDRLNEQLRSIKEREGYLQTQLASIPRDVDQSRLAELKAQLAHLSARYSDRYPDVIKTKAEIAELEKQRNNSAESSVQANNPPDNPAYITLASQLSSTQADIVSVKKQIQAANETATKSRTRIANTPKVEEAYNAIYIERNNTQFKYDDLMRKHMEARVAQGLEKEQKGERFTLIDPARLPEKPYKPNRMAIMLIGFVLSIGAGVAWASLKEVNDQSIRDSDSLTRATSFPVLAVIPEILTKKDTRRISNKRLVMITATVLIIIAGVTAFHYLIMDLNVFWAKLMRKVPL
jgi:polysaccharide chain length determinant protein (PEP-CTERM system associated)